MEPVLLLKTQDPVGVVTWPIIKDVAFILSYLMKEIYSFFASMEVYSIVIYIIVFVIIVKFLLLPLNIKQQRGLIIAKRTAPQIQLLTTKYTGSSSYSTFNKYNIERHMILMKEGHTKNITLLIILIQIPIIMSLYGIIFNFNYFVPEAAEISKSMTNHMYTLWELNLLKPASLDNKATLIIPFSVFVCQTLFGGSSAFIENGFNKIMKGLFNPLSIFCSAMTSYYCFILPTYLGVYWSVFALLSFVINIIILNIISKKDDEYFNKINLKKLNKSRKHRNLPLLNKYPNVV